MFFSPSDSMAITLPSMNSERLMFPVSLTMLPALLLLFRRSDPARSTKLTLPNLLIVTPSRLACDSTWTVIMECDRDESLLSSWLPTLRFLVPRATTASASSRHEQSTVTRSGT